MRICNVLEVDAGFENYFNGDDEEDGGNADSEIEPILHLTVKEETRRRREEETRRRGDEEDERYRM